MLLAQLIFGLPQPRLDLVVDHADTFVLPVKKQVRTRAGVEEGDEIDVDLVLLLEE